MKISIESAKHKADIIGGIKEGIEEMTLMEKNQLEGYSAKKLLDEI